MGIFTRAARFTSLALVSLAACTLASCEPPWGEGGAGVTWTPCPLVTGETENNGECADIPMPLDWERPGGDSINIRVKRIRATQPAGRQAWLLAGGPGGPSDEMVHDATVLAAHDPTIDIYLPDHRGTGGSRILACSKGMPFQDVPNAVSIWAPCIDEIKREWGDDLRHLTVTNAARDLGALIWRMRGPREEVHVMGISYGTFWALRYLHFFPNQPTSVTLDGLGYTSVTDLFHTDREFDRVGRQFMQACGADPFCASKLGPDPVARMGEFLDGLDSGRCPGLAEAGIGREDARQAFALLLSLSRRVGIPAMVYRGLRCSPADVTAVAGALERMKWNPDNPPSSEYGYSDPLYQHIGQSEISAPEPPSLEKLMEIRAATYVSSGESTLARKLRDLWPRYPRDAFADTYPNTRVPILMVSGTLDPQTVIDKAAEVASHYTREHQTFIPFEGIGHPVLWNSRMRDVEDITCGEQMWISFMQDPKAPVDRSCMARMRSFEFEGTPTLAQRIFRTADLWENP